MNVFIASCLTYLRNAKNSAFQALTLPFLLHWANEHTIYASEDILDYAIIDTCLHLGIPDETGFW